MKIKFFCPQWGSKHINFPDFVTEVKKSGYDGIEMSLPFEKDEKEYIIKTIKEHNLLYIAQHWETVTTDFEEHKKEYRKRIVNLASANPVLINTQTGKDFFTFEQNAELIRIAYDVANEYGIKLVHETHRGKFSFAAHIVADFITKIPELRIGFDVSHWCAVAETYLHDQQESIDLGISRADHIHARVGFPEGPQIPDPRVPEWQEAVNIHLGWWERIIERNRTEGKEFFTITSEFGPYPYMTILPYTQQPISNQWEINVYMMNMLREKFE
ncbi:TIM barrel protein [Draconibacterium sp.]|nr:TIM barrel protein [Draconibacterium sp.]